MREAGIDDERLGAVLRERFGHEVFRPGQLDIIRSVLSGRPTLAVMPTGFGKSLCYQLPSLLLPGVTLVVSPLLALMKDQVDRLRQRQVAAAFVNSSQSEAERAAIERDLAEGRLKLVFVAPERFRSGAFRRALSQVDVSLLAIDEAHCISEWGHSFRPDYERLGEAMADVGAARLLALTATATSDVRADILRSLRWRHAAVIVSGFDRPNLGLEIHALTTEAEKRDTIVAAIRQLHPAIVYAATRRQATAVARVLAMNGLRAGSYHAGMEKRERDDVQDRFFSGALDAVAATNAFGLGVDKQDVRLVLHSELPRSVDAYYQETGRAGRDGRPALAALLFAPKDLFLIRHLLSLATPMPAVVDALARRLARAGEPVPFARLAQGLPEGPTAGQVSAALAFLESLGVARRHYAPADGGSDTRFTAIPERPLDAADLTRLRTRAWRDRQRLERMIAFARRRSCRRAALLRELGEPAPRSSCGACDICVGPRLVPVRSRLPEARLLGGSAWAMSGAAAKVTASQTTRGGEAHAGQN